MLDVELLRNKRETVREALVKRNMNPGLVDDFLALDARWREITKSLDEARQKLNELSKARNIEEAKKIKETVKQLEQEITAIETGREEALYRIPNIPSRDVPVGKDEQENIVLGKRGIMPIFSFTPLDHVALGEKLGLINAVRAVEVAGARFVYLTGAAPLIQFALLNWIFSLLTNPRFIIPLAKRAKVSQKVFTPVLPPHMIRPEVYRKMARLSPEDKDERYHLAEDDLYLIGSAEHTMGPLHMREIMEEDQLPLRYAGFSPAYRREAGSYGKDTKGILRLHQFDKIELESFTVPEAGFREQDFFVAIQEAILQKLELSYQVVAVCTGDMGKPDVRQIDLETWMPGQNRYRETHTADYVGDYQARRLLTRIRRIDSTTGFAHMNDATAIAMGRILIAIFENYQTKEGTIKVPKVLQKYVGFEEIKKE